MTDSSQPARRPRQRSARAAMAGGAERRAALAGTFERRKFESAGTPHRTVRSASTSDGISISGSPVVYSQPTQISDQWGTFTEVISPGCFTGILPTADVRFLLGHQGLALARTASGTLRLEDTRTSLDFTATLDPRQTLASDLAIAIDRGDISQMSFGFAIAPGGDTWNDDFTYRIVNRCSELYDVSAVTYPAYPTTEIFLDADLDEELGGPDGTLNGSGPGGQGNQDGTGTRARIIDIDADLLRLKRRHLTRKD